MSKHRTSSPPLGIDYTETKRVALGAAIAQLVKTFEDEQPGAWVERIDLERIFADPTGDAPPILEAVDCDVFIP